MEHQGIAWTGHYTQRLKKSLTRPLHRKCKITLLKTRLISSVIVVGVVFVVKKNHGPWLPAPASLPPSTFLPNIIYSDEVPRCRVGAITCVMCVLLERLVSKGYGQDEANLFV